VRILVADDHESIRAALIGVLASRQPDWIISGVVSNPEDAIAVSIASHPDVAIINFSRRLLNGEEVAARLHQSVPNTRILMLSLHAHHPSPRGLKATGASVYLLNTELPAMLVRAVERTLATQAFAASTSQLNETCELLKRVPVQWMLTAKELEVLGMISLGQHNKELAFNLNVSGTVESHRARILSKLNLRSVGALVRIAIRDHVN